MRTSMTTTRARSGVGGAGGEAVEHARDLRTGGGKIDAEPAGTEPGGTDAVSQDRLRRSGDRSVTGDAVPGGAPAAAQADHSRPPTDDPPHGHQEGRFFHGSYDCYCHL